MSTETNTPSPDAMNVISDTLEPVIDTWDDPGVYPSGAGGYRLPSRRYVEYVDGSITIDLTAENLIYAIEQEMWGPLELETRPKIRVKKWHAAKLAVIDGSSPQLLSSRR